MLPKISKKTMRAALIVMVVAMMIPVLAASASDNRPTGLKHCEHRWVNHAVPNPANCDVPILGCLSR